MTSIAILGANGRLSRTVAKAFLKAGYEVTAITRSGTPLDELRGAKFVAADAANLTGLLAATKGADIIFNGLNPLYTEWEEKVMPLAHNVMAACKANGAVHLFPGNVYGYGSPMPLELTEDTPMRPSNSKGRIRVAMKELFRNESEKTGGVQTIVLRAGDYFGGTGKGTWLDFVLISKLSKGIYTAPGPENLVHEWAYLPDFAEAFVKLANARDTLLPFENLNFPGHAITDLQIKASIEKLTGKPLKLAHLPWRVLRILGIFQPMIKALVEMSYLRFQPHRLVSKRLAGLIGNVPHTPLDEAIKQALIDQGLSVANIQKSA